MKAIIAILAIAGLGAVFTWERAAIGTLRPQNESLRADKLEAERLADENRDLPNLRARQPAAAGHGVNLELLRLRNEVTKLREEQAEIQRQRAANQHVAEELKSGKFTPRRLADMEGAVPREQWSFAGFATPEAAVQNFFAAIATADPEQIMRCMSPKDAESLRRQMAKDPEGTRKDFDREFGKLGNVSGFRITGTRILGEDKMEVLVQVVAGGQSMPLPLRRVDNEWRLGE
jgi:hypothetical protein